MKKIRNTIILGVIFILCMPFAFFAGGCDGDRSPEIVVTIFPIYDWTRVILGDNPADFKVRYLLETGVDLHLYTASFQDIADISDCYLFIYVGGKSDGWTLNALANRRNQERQTLSLMNLVLDEAVMGGDDCCGGESFDEHIWLSLNFTIRFVEAIRDKIIALDPANTSIYSANAAAYIANLEALRSEFSQMVEEATQDTIIIADRFPFVYFINDLGIDFYAAFDGCTAATDVPPARRANLINAINRLNPQAILTINNRALAETIRRDSNYEPDILYLQDFQTVSRNMVNNGFTFLQGMQANLESLARALA